MTRAEMPKLVQSIKEPLVHLTAFSDGFVCDYVTSTGCGGFELLDWSDLMDYDYNSPDEAWDALDDFVIRDWVSRIEACEYGTIDSNMPTTTLNSGFE